MELPEDVRRVVRTANSLERLNREVGRRANVVGVFPNDCSVRRLADSFLIEENDRWQQKRKLYYSPVAIETEARVPRLARIAKQQAELRKAAKENRDFEFTHRLGLDPKPQDGFGRPPRSAPDRVQAARFVHDPENERRAAPVKAKAAHRNHSSAPLYSFG